MIRELRFHAAITNGCKWLALLLQLLQYPLNLGKPGVRFYWHGSEFVSLRQLHKIPEQLQSDPLAFFRVKLRGKHVVLPNRRRKIFAVLRARGYDAGILRPGKEAVDEIDKAAVLNSTEERAIALDDVELVPADLRDFQAILFGKTHDAAFENSQAGSAGIKLFAPLKERLVADTDAEERFASLDEGTHSFEQFLLLHGVQAIVKRANARQHDGAGAAHFRRRLRDADVRAGLEQRLVHAAQIAGAVIQKSNHRQSC